jgi:type I restriction enzyme S subunit
MASDTWSDVKLSEVIDVKHGFAFSGDNIREDPPGDILLTPGNFAVGGGFKRDKYKYFDGHVPDEYVLQESDLIVTMTDLSKQADTLGYPALVPKSQQFRFLHNQRLGKVLIRDEAKVDRRFIFYLLRTPAYRHEVLASATGTTVKHTSPSRILGFKTSIPPLLEQHAIAHILGTLDDKIELNRRMNETLEAMARALFKSWFVDFDPVRAKAESRELGLPARVAELFSDSFNDSELGEIPKGWQVGTFDDVAEHPRRGVQPDGIDPSTPYIALEHMPRRSIALSEWSTADGLESNKFEFNRGEILFGKLRPYFHKVGVAPVAGVCSTDIVVVAPREDAWFGFVLGHVSSDAFVEYTTSGSTGTKMPRTSWSEMGRYPTVLPPQDVATTFTSLLRPLIDRINSSIHESRTLAALRDTLLPKLISGELGLMDAERVAGSAL